MLDIFKRVRSAKLRGLIVWVPMVRGDSALEAAALVSPDERFVLQSWDAQRSVGEAFARTLKLNCPAWDVYLLYKPGVRWDEGDAPMPSVWMHQLGDYAGADPTLHLEPAVLKTQVEQAI